MTALTGMDSTYKREGNIETSPLRKRERMGSEELIIALDEVSAGYTASLGGLFLSYRFDLPSGATIVLTISVIFGLCTAFSPKRKQCEWTRLESTEKERKRT